MIRILRIASSALEKDFHFLKEVIKNRVKQKLFKNKKVGFKEVYLNRLNNIYIDFKMIIKIFKI